ncbi:hypothetical protein DNTS_027334 [Danionella cerebrum]|uniref:Peptidase metallopeptidase domain-containing protein n=1 Tax=Danionella cerebrum TaxID=2873325 RepID=A0A553MXS8_9TELE|nr:hypothetical protein DNTS_027334 [Danionella translucida]
MGNVVIVCHYFREFQWLSHLPITGQLDNGTLVMMTSSRCGVTDAGSYRAWQQRVNSILTGYHLRKKRQARLGEKWHKKELSYRIMNWPRTLSPSQVHVAVKTAFELWSNISGLVFHELLQGPTDLRLAFYDGEHNDGTGNAFDGPGGALAHAFFPFRGEAHFDLSERWTLSTRKGHDLFLVSAHEIGHTLGLLHSPVQHSLMSPFYKRRRSRALLSWDDITAIQQLYGKPPGGGFEQVTDRSLRRSLMDPQSSPQLRAEDLTGTPRYCHGHFDAITSGQRSMLYKIIKGDHMWRFSDTDLDPGFPLKNSKLGLAKHLDCAFFYPPLGKMVLFKGSRYFLLNPETLKVEPYYPRALRDWKGIPRGVNGVINRPDGALYFFKEQQYWRFDPGKLRITTRGRWEESLEWISCKRTAPPHE